MTPISPVDTHAISHARAACYKLYQQQPAGQSRKEFRKLVAAARQQEPSLAAVSVRQLRKEVLSLSLLEEWERARQQQDRAAKRLAAAGASAPTVPKRRRTEQPAAAQPRSAGAAGEGSSEGRAPRSPEPAERHVTVRGRRSSERGRRAGKRPAAVAAARRRRSSERVRVTEEPWGSPAGGSAAQCCVVAPPAPSAEERRAAREWLRPLRSGAEALEVLGTVRSIPLTREKLACLRDGEWLNEEVINAYLGVVEGAAEALPPPPPGWRRPRLHIPLTYFYSRLSDEGRGYDYTGVRRWLRKVQLFPPAATATDTAGGEGGGEGLGECIDAVLVPLHLGSNHWALMAIDLAARRFLYYDSLRPGRREARRHAGLLWRWLCDEAERRHERRLPCTPHNPPTCATR